jgi:hypothetical protein
MVTTVVPASVLGVVVLPLAGTTLVLLVLLEPSAGLGMGIGTVVLGVVDGVVVTGAVYTTRMARRSRIRASRPNRRAGVVVVTTVGTVGAAGAVAAGFGEFKRSGIGSKAGGPDYLLQFLWPRSVTINQLRRGFAPDTVSD